MIDSIRQSVEKEGVLPIIRCKSTADGEQQIRALASAGFSCVEVTFTTPGACQLIKQAREAGMTVGAGTVCTAEMAQEAFDAGAQFIASPGWCEEAARIATQNSHLYIPGVLTPTEVQAAFLRGYTFVKVFPIDAMGGASYIKALKAPFPQMDFFVTGGLCPESARGYWAAGASVVGMGSQLFTSKPQGDLVTHLRASRETLTALMATERVPASIASDMPGLL